MSAFLLAQLSVVCPRCDGLNAPNATGCQLCQVPLVTPGPAVVPPGRRAPTPVPGQPLSAPTPQARPAVGKIPPGVIPAARPGSSGPRSSAPAPRPQTASVTAPPASAADPAGAGPSRPSPAARPGHAPEGIPPGMRPTRPSGPGAAPTPRPAPQPSRFIVGVVAGSAQGQRFRLLSSGCWLGRAKGAILFPDDVHVSPQHAAFRFRDDQLFVRDEASVSGVYVSITGQELIAPGTLFCAGNRVFRFLGMVPQPPIALGRAVPYGAPVPPGGALFGVEELLVGARPGRAVVTGGPLLTVGQGHCDLSYPDDAALAPRHLELTLSGQGAILRDLSGGLGTYVRIGVQERALRPGDRVRIGQQTLQIELAA